MDDDGVGDDELADWLDQADAAYENPGELGALDAAIDEGRRVAGTTPDDDPDLFMLLGMLATLLGLRYRLGGEAALLDEAVTVQRRAVALCDDDHPALAVLRHDLANRLVERCAASGSSGEGAGDRADIDEAIALRREAVDATSPTDPDRIAQLANLAGDLAELAWATGDGRPLREAVDRQQEAMAMVPGRGPRRQVLVDDLARYVHRFVDDRHRRFRATAESAPLDEAVEAARAAIGPLPVDHPERTRLLADLALLLGERYEVAGDAADLELGLEVMSQALAGLADDDPRRPLFLDRQASLLASDIGRTGDAALLELVIRRQREAVDRLAEGYAGLAIARYGLAQRLGARYQATGDRAALDEAIAAARSGIEGLGPDDPTAGQHRNQLWRVSSAAPTSGRSIRTWATTPSRPPARRWPPAGRARSRRSTRSATSAASWRSGSRPPATAPRSPSRSSDTARRSRWPRRTASTRACSASTWPAASPSTRSRAATCLAGTRPGDCSTRPPAPVRSSG